MEENKAGVCVACGAEAPNLNGEGKCENCAPKAEGGEQPAAEASAPEAPAAEGGEQPQA